MQALFLVDLCFIKGKEVIYYLEDLWSIEIENLFTSTVYEKTWGIHRLFLD